MLSWLTFFIRVRYFPVRFAFDDPVRLRNIGCCLSAQICSVAHVSFVGFYFFRHYRFLRIRFWDFGRNIRCRCPHDVNSAADETNRRYQRNCHGYYIFHATFLFGMFVCRQSCIFKHNSRIRCIRGAMQLIYTWDDATARWLQEKASKQSLVTDKVLIRWLDNHLSGVPLHDIDRSVVSSLTHKKIATGVTNATVNRMLSFLRALLNMAALDWDWLPSSPKVRLLREPTRRIRYLKKAEAVRLLRELPEHLSAMAAFSLATGLRRANVTGLEWSQVDMSRQLAWIHADQAKGGRSLAVPLNTDAMRVLLTRVGRHSRYVFSYQGERVTQVSTAAWYKALKRAGISDFRWHDLRHTWASWHVQNGTPLFALQELGGWGSTEMVRRYAHFSVGNLVSYASNLPTFSGP